MFNEHFMRGFDRFMSAPPNFLNQTYEDRIRKLFTDLVHRRKPPLRTFISLSRLSFLYGLSYILLPISFPLKLLGFRFVNIDLAQIGSIIYLDLLLREDALTRQTPKYKMIALASRHTDCNRYVLDLYDDKVTFIRNYLLNLLLAPFFMSRIFSDNSFRYDLSISKVTISHDIWKRYMEKFGRHVIEFPPADIPKAQELLGRHIPAGTKFVALHVRETGFYEDPDRTSRNADIKDYKQAIKYMIGKGYAVVRLGNEKMSDISDMIAECGPLLFDYAHSDIRSEMMDCYLMSKCAFFIGMASGPASLPVVFGANSCNINWWNAYTGPNFIPGDLTSFKKLRYISDNSLVPLDTLLRPPFSLNPTTKILAQIGVKYENNTEQEILDTVIEFIERPFGEASEIQKIAQAKLLPTNYAFGAVGYFSHTILKDYFRPLERA